MTQELRIRSRWWYLLPIFFNVIGGVIAYFILRDNDPKKAKNCLLLGIALIAIKIILVVIFFTICTTVGPCAEFEDEFMSGMMGSGMMDEGIMETMMQDAQFHDQVMDYMAKNPEQMNQWMVHDPKHVEEMATAMRENHDFMMEMTSVILNDPDLRLQMLGHMTENPESMEQMKKMVGQSMMGSEMMNP